MASSPAPTMQTSHAGFRQREFPRWIALLLALAAWWLSFELTLRSFGSQPIGIMAALCSAKPGDASGDGCRSVLASEWASVPLSSRPGTPRLPIAAVGMAYFSALTLWLVFAGGGARVPRVWQGLVIAVTLIGLVFSLDFLRIMKFVIGQWCVGCLTVHALNFAIFLLLILLFPFRGPDKSRHPSHGLALAALTAGALAFLLHLVFFAARLSEVAVRPLQDAYSKIVHDPEFARWHFQRQPIVSEPLDRTAGGETPDGRLIGPESAVNELVIFSDFQCPQCERLHAMIETLLAEQPPRLRVLYRHYPLNSACNPHAESAKHPESCRAARAWEAAYRVGGREAAARMGRALFANQNQLNEAGYEQLAAQIGLDGGAFGAALQSPELDATIAGDIALADRIGVTTTPAVFLNGRRFDHWLARETWDALLAAPGASPPAWQANKP